VVEEYAVFMANVAVECAGMPEVTK
jgi:hypothetical protein